ncbi:MAG: HD domain-containing protein [Lachnospiraceae bacterium]|nr:HD domain-containing protein [Lachnospiraceae bacterium]
MKKVLIVDGNENDESVVKKNLGDAYDVASVSMFDFDNMALATVITIANTLDSLDVYSGGRSLRIAVCARDIARNLGWDERECQNVYFVSLLHDMGMITVSENIRNKPARLTPDEYDIVRKHTARGAEMLRDIYVVDNLSDGVMYHHERWDGKGYPKGLAGEEIPKIARVIAVADAFDAMSSDRVYRAKLSTDKIISEFLRCKGTQFDPDIADVFIFMLKDGYTVDPDIEQTKEASERASADGGLRKIFTSGGDVKDGELDALTGLFSRSYLNTRVSKKISEERSGALMVIDVCDVQQLDEAERDDIIKKFAEKLMSLFREADVVCRISSDRFAAYVSGESGKVVIEKKASSIVEAQDNVVIGISMCQENGLTFEELYGAALSALEDAKSAGAGTYRFKEA